MLTGAGGTDCYDWARYPFQQLATACGPSETLLDHWEINPNLVDLSPMQRPLGRSQAAHARKWRGPLHTAAEIRVLLLRYGIGCPPTSPPT
ncbi:hypothetical protein IV102_25365 [bacterium]|nr:hypothetical protein [bacterium]